MDDRPPCPQGVSTESGLCPHCPPAGSRPASYQGGRASCQARLKGVEKSTAGPFIALLAAAVACSTAAAHWQAPSGVPQPSGQCPHCPPAHGRPSLMRKTSWQLQACPTASVTADLRNCILLPAELTCQQQQTPRALAIFPPGMALAAVAHVPPHEQATAGRVPPHSACAWCTQSSPAL